MGVTLNSGYRLLVSRLWLPATGIRTLAFGLWWLVFDKETGGTIYC